MVIQRNRYDKEMRSKLVEMGFDEFMTRFMPGPELLPESVLNIPNMNKEELMKSEKCVCVEIVRVIYVSMLCRSLIGCPQTVQSRAGHL